MVGLYRRNRIQSSNQVQFRNDGPPWGIRRDQGPPMLKLTSPALQECEHKFCQAQKKSEI